MKKLITMVVASSLLFTGAVALDSGNTAEAANKSSNNNKNSSNYVKSKSWEGVVTSYDEVNISIDVPFEGEKKFSVSNNVRIKDRNNPLKVGSLVEVETKSDVVYEIETELSIEGRATIISNGSKSVTLEKNGKQETYQKAAKFRLDKDGYKGDIVNMSAEFHINSSNQITELEIDFDD